MGADAFGRPRDGAISPEKENRKQTNNWKGSQQSHHSGWIRNWRGAGRGRWSCTRENTRDTAPGLLPSWWDFLWGLVTQDPTAFPWPQQPSLKRTSPATHLVEKLEDPGPGKASLSPEPRSRLKTAIGQPRGLQAPGPAKPSEEQWCNWCLQALASGIEAGLDIKRATS